MLPHSLSRAQVFQPLSNLSSRCFRCHRLHLRVHRSHSLRLFYVDNTAILNSMVNFPYLWLFFYYIPIVFFLHCAPGILFSGYIMECGAPWPPIHPNPSVNTHAKYLRLNLPTPMIRVRFLSLSIANDNIHISAVRRKIAGGYCRYVLVLSSSPSLSSFPRNATIHDDSRFTKKSVVFL